jgi:hypothetical protein
VSAADTRLGPLAYLVARIADIAHMGAFITVSDATGRVLFRRPATVDEVNNAVRAAQAAEVEAQAAMARIARERIAHERDEAPPG